jgi:hypothetical protein
MSFDSFFVVDAGELFAWSVPTDPLFYEKGSTPQLPRTMFENRFPSLWSAIRPLSLSDFLSTGVFAPFVKSFEVQSQLGSLAPSLPDLNSIFLGFELLQDWRCLKLEREVWRTIDMLSLAQQSSLYRRKFYSNFYDPASLASKVSL